MPVYLSFSSMMLARPLGSIRGSASSSPRICGQLVEGQLDLEDVMAGRLAGPGSRPRRRRSGRSACRRRRAPGRPRRDSWSRSGTRGSRSAAGGSRRTRPPVLPIISPWVMYLRRSVLILPADDLLEPIGVPLDFSHHGCLALAAGSGGLLCPIAPKVAADCPEAQHFACRAQRSTEPKIKRSLGISPGTKGRGAVEDDSACVGPVDGANDPRSPTANCIPVPRAGQVQCKPDSIIERSFSPDSPGISSSSTADSRLLRPVRRLLEAPPELEVLLADVGIQFVGELDG